ncbi:MAG: aldo/keto reductase [Actinomycetota bacterium]
MGYYGRFFASGKLEANLEIVDALRPIADRLDVTLAQLALAWVVHQRGVTGAIAGSRSPQHVAENAGAGSVLSRARTSRRSNRFSREVLRPEARAPAGGPPKRESAMLRPQVGHRSPFAA